MKIQQTAIMLIAITMFFVLVGLFLLSFNVYKIKEGATNQQEENAITLASKISNSPEFACGRAFDEIKLNCIDLDKVMVLKENINKYSTYWDIAGITIIRIFPVFSESRCNLATYPNCGILEVYNSGKTQGADYSSFVTLCRKEEIAGETINKCELGKILVYPKNLNE